MLNAEKIKKRLFKKLILIGEFVEGEAKLRCPVDTGNLRDSIKYRVDESEAAVIIGTNVEYAPYVEFGTAKMQAQPYLRPAVIENKEQIMKILNAN